MATPDDLLIVAQALNAAGTATAAQITRARLEAEWHTKRTPHRAQDAPVGLFAQTQGTLFEEEGTT